MNSRLLFTPGSDGDYYIAVNSTSILTGTYQVSVSHYVRPDDYGADTDTTGSVSVGGSATGQIEVVQDTDWFKVSLEAGKSYRFDVDSGGLEDPYVRLFDTNGVLIPGAQDDNSGIGLRSVVFFTPETGGEYFISAEAGGLAYLGTHDIGSYTVTATEITADDYSADQHTTGSVDVGGSVTGIGDRLTG